MIELLALAGGFMPLAALSGWIMGLFNEREIRKQNSLSGNLGIAEKYRV